MSVFKVMDGDFGIDGLISSHTVAPAFATSDEAYRFIVEQSLRGGIWTREEAPGWWVEEHREADKRSPVYVTVPYPSVSRPAPPRWFKNEMAKWVKPSKEEHAAYLEASLAVARAAGAAQGERERLARETQNG
jgi:hypothetical protein